MTEHTTQMSSSLQDSIRKIEEIFEPMLTEGAPLYSIRGLSKEDLDALYVIAYNLYSEQKYKKAVRIFEAINFYNHADRRGWMGTAACYQMLGRYSDAIICYTCASLLDAKDPLPLLHSVECYLALKKYSEALSALETILNLNNANPELVHFKNLATQMKETLQNVQ